MDAFERIGLQEDKIYNKRWKQLIAEKLKELAIIDDDFDGEIIIQIHEGGVRNIKASKFIK